MYCSFTARRGRCVSHTQALRCTPLGLMPTDAASQCAACAVKNAVVLTIATNPSYYAQADQLAASASAHGIPCVCTAISDAISPKASHHHRLVPLLLAKASRWRPPYEWCSRQLSGWRHAGILKMHAIEHLLQQGHDVLVVDVDWRFSGNPLPSLRRSGRSVLAARDQTRHMLNVGAMYVAADPRTLSLARRAANRTYEAWDQAVFTEEAGASGASCCWANDLGGRFLVHPPVTRQEKLRVRGSSQECASPSPRTPRGMARTWARTWSLPPPRNSSRMAARSMWRARWRSSAYNELAASFYRWRCAECDNVCMRTRCDLAPSSI